MKDIFISKRELNKKVKVAVLLNRNTTISCGSNLMIRIKNGSATYCLRYEFSSPKRQVITKTIGNYKDYSLEEIMLIRDTLVKDINKIVENRSKGKKQKNNLKNFAKEMCSRTGTFLYCAELYLEYIKGKSKNNKRYITLKSQLNSLKNIWNSNVRSVKPISILKILNNNNFTPTKKYHVQSFANSVLNYAVALGFLERNPCTYLAKYFPIVRGNGYAWKSAEELNEFFFSKLENINLKVKYFLTFITLSCLRIGEAHLIEWKDIDFNKKVIFIPKKNTKTNKDFSLFMTSQIINLLQNLIKDFGKNSKYVFADPTNNLNPWHIRHYQGPVAAVCKGSCTIHGLRKSACTWMTSNGIDIHIADKCLSHFNDNRTTKTYNHYDFFKERAEALSKWNDFIVDQFPQSFKTLVTIN